MSDDRKQYRAPGPGDPEVQPFLSRPGEDPVPCRILDASVGGIAVQVSYEDPIDLELDEAVWLRLEAEHLVEPLLTPGAVRRKTVVDGGIAYGFAFLDWLGFLASCPPALRALFNQRGECRVPFPARDIEVTLERDVPMTGWLIDLSPYGLSLAIATEAEDAITRGERISVTFELPCEGGNLCLQVVTLHAAWENGTLRCGACFDMATTRDFAAQRETIEKFLATRLRQASARTAG